MAPNYESEELESGSEDESVEEEAAPKKRSKKAWKVRAVYTMRLHVPLLIVCSLTRILCLCNDQDPAKPKRAMSAFFLYSQGNRTRVKEENPEASFGEIVSHTRILHLCCFRVLRLLFCV